MSTNASDPLQPVNSRRLPGLDGMRALSIGLVLCQHGWLSLRLPSQFTLVFPFFANAALGVTVFFVLSGFLITYLLRREFDRSARIDLKAFYARRMLRIFPALYSYLLVISLLMAAGWIQTTRGDFLCASTFLTNYGFLFHAKSNADYWFIGHFWTLSLEEQFYLLWPVIIVFVGIGRAWKVALAIVLASPCIRTASYFLWPASRVHLGMMLHTSSDPIMMGCLAALLSDRPIVNRMLNFRFSSLLAAGCAFFVAIPSALLADRFRGSYVVPIGTALNSAMIAYCVLFVTRRPDTLGVRILEWKLLRQIGILSYSLYLWQQLFLGGASWGRWTTFPLNYLACIAAALASNFIIERPFLKLRGRFSGTARTRPLPVPVSVTPPAAVTPGK